VKGIAHFAAGVAVATFFPEVVHTASQSLSFGPMLGGVAGLLPDTLDFKLVRYLVPMDEEIDPAQLISSAGLPDPQAIAERIAAAMNRAFETGERAVVQLHTVKLGAGLWRQYSVAFDQAHQQVLVRIGPVVTTGLVSYPTSEIPGLKLGRAQVQGRIQPTYDAETTIDIFSGPSMAFERVGDALKVTFVPWHRIWTHSLVMVLLIGALGALIAPVYGAVLALAMLAHIVADQMGHLGSNLFFPLSRRRTQGWRLMRSGDAVPNLLVVWLSLACILLNLDRFSQASVIPVGPYVLGVIILPCLLLMGLSVWGHLQKQNQTTPLIGPSVLVAVEALDETSEVDI
jgi:membrane-bound metal-dependent hydrolase YbcI (DUF457 family)